MQTRFIQSINDIDAADWNSLCGTDYPFLRHEFFAALENSGSTSYDNGWQPYHLLLEDNDKLVGIMPLFFKMHSYGEFVFDWAWAEAYQRNGLGYYPKLLNAIPFTPSTGPRWALSDQVNQAEALQKMHNSITGLIDKMHLSSGHILFPAHDAVAL